MKATVAEHIRMKQQEFEALFSGSGREALAAARETQARRAGPLADFA